MSAHSPRSIHLQSTLNPSVQPLTPTSLALHLCNRDTSKATKKGHSELSRTHVPNNKQQTPAQPLTLTALAPHRSTSICSHSSAVTESHTAVTQLTHAATDTHSSRSMSLPPRCVLDQFSQSCCCQGGCGACPGCDSPTSTCVCAMYWWGGWGVAM